MQRDVHVLTEIEDGRGGRLVWLADAGANLWLCGADAEGRIYLHELIFDDLLRGAGAKLLPPVSVDRGGKPVLPADFLGIAQDACFAYLDAPAGTVLDSGADGLTGAWVPGYFVVLGTPAGERFLCNATATARVWVFAEIDPPLRMPLSARGQEISTMVASPAPASTVSPTGLPMIAWATGET